MYHFANSSIAVVKTQKRKGNFGTIKCQFFHMYILLIVRKTIAKFKQNAPDATYFCSVLFNEVFE